MITPQNIAYRRFVAVRADQDHPAYAIMDTVKGETIKTIVGIGEETANETYRRSLVEAGRMNEEDFRERKALRSAPIVKGSGVSS